MAKVNKDLLQEILLLLNVISNKVDKIEKSLNVAIVRPEVKKSGWYGDQIKVEEVENQLFLE